ncbi:MAG: hypothetical protein FWG46_05795 [Treponema sp.]|nr:hypothetical protein [Treponema sp.]
MANKNFWLGILVMVLVFGMTVVGCDNGNLNPQKVGENEWLFRNRSSYTIVVNISSIQYTPLNFKLEPSTEQLIRREDNIKTGVAYSWRREDGSMQTGVIARGSASDRTITFSNR